METIRYTGEDIPVDITMTDTGGAVIMPDQLQGIKVFAVDNQDVVQRAAHPPQEGHEPLEIIGQVTRMWLKRELTATLINRKLQFEVAIYETQQGLEDDLQKTIALSEKIVVRNALIKQEEIPDEDNS